MQQCDRDYDDFHLIVIQVMKLVIVNISHCHAYTCAFKKMKYVSFTNNEMLLTGKAYLSLFLFLPIFNGTRFILLIKILNTYYTTPWKGVV